VEYQVISQFNSLANQFLISMPQMLDPNFSGTLTYICEHNEEGAMGVIINRQIKIGLNDILAQLDMPSVEKTHPIYWGGPVQEDRGFIIHTSKQKTDQKWESSMEICQGIRMTTSKDIIKAISENQGPEKFIIALGYAGWGSGQLEKELAENTWLCSPANEQLLFDVDVLKKRKAAINSLGITEHQLNSQIGHA
jgi:putative transcriptional regulator